MEKRVYLPEEIITPSRLDLKSMIKCMVVCKEWRNLVSNNPLVPTSQSLVYSSLLQRFGALDDDTNQIAWMHGEPRRTRIEGERFMWPCNGLVCLLSDYSTDIYIFNPLIGEHTTIPNPYVRDISQLNLGFCASSNEYKLTMFTPYALEICTLRSPIRWRSVQFEQQKLRSFSRAAVCVDGVLHWLLETRSILTFDLAKEVLGSIPPPPLEDGKMIHQFECLDHCLVVTAGYSSPLGLDIWVRKKDKSSGESVWTKNWVIDADQPLIGTVFYSLIPQKLSTDGCIIMRDLYTYLYSYDSRDKLVRYHRDCDRFGRRLCSDYTPTLISPKKLMQKTD